MYIVYILYVVYVFKILEVLYTYMYISIFIYIDVFSGQGKQTPIKMEGPGDPGDSESRLLAPIHKIFQSRPNNYPDFLKAPPKITNVYKQQEAV